LDTYDTESILLGGAEFDPAFSDAVVETLVFEKSPCSFRTTAVVTLAAAGAPRVSNHSSQILRPLRARYSLMVIMSNGNILLSILQAH
jgi:hypothetical protein